MRLHEQVREYNGSRFPFAFCAYELPSRRSYRGFFIARRWEPREDLWRYGNDMLFRFDRAQKIFRFESKVCGSSDNARVTRLLFAFMRKKYFKYIIRVARAERRNLCINFSSINVWIISRGLFDIEKRIEICPGQRFSNKIKSTACYHEIQRF